MSLNRRDIKLLEKINNNIFPISSLAEKYSVSERNIRYSIDNINFYLRKMELPEIVIKKGNLEFSINDKELDSFIEALNMNIYVFSQEERKDYIMELQKTISARKCEKFTGKTIRVMVDGRMPEEGVYCGRSYRDAPDIDGMVFFKADYDIMSGDWADVRIDEAGDYDLIGEAVY